MTSRLTSLLTAVAAVTIMGVSAQTVNASQLIAGGTPSLVGGTCVLGSAWMAANGLVADTTSADPSDQCGFDFTAHSSGSASTLTQSGLPTIAGDIYTLSFEIEDFQGSGGEFDIDFDGVMIDFFVSGGVLSGRGWSQDFYTTGGVSAFGEVHDLIANPGAGGSVVSFSGFQGSGAWYIDDISLTGAALPEPSTMVTMFSAMLLSVGLVCRRVIAASRRSQ